MKEFSGAVLGGLLGGALVGFLGLWWIIRKVDM